MGRWWAAPAPRVDAVREKAGHTRGGNRVPARPARVRGPKLAGPRSRQARQALPAREYGVIGAHVHAAAAPPRRALHQRRPACTTIGKIRCMPFREAHTFCSKQLANGSEIQPGPITTALVQKPKILNSSTPLLPGPVPGALNPGGTTSEAPTVAPSYLPLGCQAAGDSDVGSARGDREADARGSLVPFFADSGPSPASASLASSLGMSRYPAAGCAVSPTKSETVRSTEPALSEPEDPSCHWRISFSPSGMARKEKGCPVGEASVAEI